MSHLVKRQRQLRLLGAATGHFSGLLPPFGGLQAHSSLRSLQKPASGHPDVGQRKQRDELCGVLGKPPIAHFDVTELALDDPKADRKSNRMCPSVAHVWGVPGVHTVGCWGDFSRPVARDFSV